MSYRKLHHLLRSDIDNPPTMVALDDTGSNDLLALQRERPQPEAIRRILCNGIQLDDTILGETLPCPGDVDGVSSPFQMAAEGRHEAWIGVA